jgi:2,3-bisphosphoglycerate-dependent phosphoglycerate mutase
VTALLLARHGQTDDNLAGDVFQGFRDTPLNATGRQQAHVLAEKVAESHPIRTIWASDLSRAAETARIVGDRVGLTPRLDPRLREGNRGLWEGRRFAEVEAEQPELYADWLRAGPDFRFPDGETLLEQQTRVLAALADLRASGPLPALAVCHRGSIRVVMCAEDPRGLWAFHRHDVDNTGVVEL